MHSAVCRPIAPGRVAPYALPLLCALAGCVAPMLALPGSGQLVWALLQPLVGLDPNTVNLWEQPLIRERLTDFLGDRYAPVMQLVRTANELKQEGPLFYVVSRYTPAPELAERAGLVWDKDTNRFAALLQRGDVTELFTERTPAAAGAAPASAPRWPAELAPLAALALPPVSQLPREPLVPATLGREFPASAAPAGDPVAAPAAARRAPITGPTHPVPPPQ